MIAALLVWNPIVAVCFNVTFGGTHDFFRRWLVALVIFFGAFNEYFLTVFNLQNVMVQATVLGMLGLAIVDEQLAERFGGDVLRRAGVGWGFLTVAEQWPTAPDHDLHDEERWWAGLSEQPPSMTAVRDLDLVPDDRWSDALALMANDPATALLLADRAGYTAWWLREHARINGREVRSYRRPDAEVLAGIVDPLDHPDAAALGGILVDDVVADVATAALILTNLGDADRPILPGAVVRGYGEVVAAIARGDVDLRAKVSWNQAAAGATIVVQPSLEEGFGLAMLEAFAFARPVILSDSPALVEVAADAGHVVERGDERGYPKRLGEAIAGLLEDPKLRASLGTRGEDRSHAFSWRDSAEKVWQLHADL